MSTNIFLSALRQVISKTLVRFSESMEEFILLTAIIGALGVSIYYDYQKDARGAHDIVDFSFLFYPYRSLIIVFLFVFPLYYREVFGKMPLQSFLESLRGHRPTLKTEGEAPPQINSIDGLYALYSVQKLNSHELQSVHTINTVRLAQRVLRQGNIFVLAGVSTAFAGVVFYYLLHVTRMVDVQANSDWQERLISFGQNLGVFLLIEYVALFLLRQYRLNTDEFRYFDSIARARQDSLVAMKIRYEMNDAAAAKDAIELARLFSTVGRLGKDESTELLEARKLMKDDIVLIERAFDLAKAARSETTDEGKKEKK